MEKVRPFGRCFHGVFEVFFGDWSGWFYAAAHQQQAGRNKKVFHCA
jgi:hypothetical protein